MNKNLLPIVLLFIATVCNSQNAGLIIETDSINLYETFISTGSKSNIFPTAYKDGLLYCNEGNSGYRLIYSDGNVNKKISGLGARYVFGPPAIFNDEIYFNRYSNKSNTEGAFNVTLYKGKLENYKIVKPKIVEFCDNEYTYSHPAISKDGKTMVVVTNERGAFHLLSLKRDENGNWKRDEVLFITQGTGELINPTFFDENTLFFASNNYDGKIQEIENIYENGVLVAADVYREPSDFDIYKIEKIDGVWRIPIKAAVLNSEFDDLGVVFTEKNKGYLTSFRYNDTDNIYFFELKE